MPRQKSARPGQVGGVRDTNRRETLDKLRGAALALFLAKGVEAVTIDMIVARAKMAKGSFYQYARNKAGVVAMIMQPVADEVNAALARCDFDAATKETIAGVYVQLATDLSQVVQRHERAVLLYLQEARGPRADRLIAAIATSIEEQAIAMTVAARDHGLIRDVDPRVSALTVVGAIDALLYEQLRDKRADVAATIRELVGIVLLGIRR